MIVGENICKGCRIFEEANREESGLLTGSKYPTQFPPLKSDPSKQCLVFSQLLSYVVPHVESAVVIVVQIWCCRRVKGSGLFSWFPVAPSNPQLSGVKNTMNAAGRVYTVMRSDVKRCDAMMRCVKNTAMS